MAKPASCGQCVATSFHSVVLLMYLNFWCNLKPFYSLSIGFYTVFMGTSVTYSAQWSKTKMKCPAGGLTTVLSSGCCLTEAWPLASNNFLLWWVQKHLSFIWSLKWSVKHSGSITSKWSTTTLHCWCEGKMSSTFALRLVSPGRPLLQATAVLCQPLCKRDVKPMLSEMCSYSNMQHVALKTGFIQLLMWDHLPLSCGEVLCSVWLNKSEHKLSTKCS